MRIMDVKSLTDGTLILEGYASTFHNRDRHGDIIDPHAFDETMERYMQKPLVLAFHDFNRPIGGVREATIDTKGLRAIAEIPPATDKETARIRRDIETGHLNSFSIGGYFHREVKDNQKIIRKVDLLEISVVKTPANPEATFTVAGTKSADGLPFEIGDPVEFEVKGLALPKKLSAFVEVEGPNTPDFLAFLFGHRAYGMKSDWFTLEAESAEELLDQLDRVKRFARRTGVYLTVHTPTEVDALIRARGGF